MINENISYPTRVMLFEYSLPNIDQVDENRLIRYFRVVEFKLMQNKF